MCHFRFRSGVTSGSAPNVGVATWAARGTACARTRDQAGKHLSTQTLFRLCVNPSVSREGAKNRVSDSKEARSSSTANVNDPSDTQLTDCGHMPSFSRVPRVCRWRQYAHPHVHEPGSISVTFPLQRSLHLGPDLAYRHRRGSKERHRRDLRAELKASDLLGEPVPPGLTHWEFSVTVLNGRPSVLASGQTLTLRLSCTCWSF